MIGTDILKAKKILEAEDLVAIPTETVYGLAGNAYSEKAVGEIFRVKDRPTFDPLIVHTNRLERAGDFVEELPDWALKLGAAFLPGPLTLLLPKGDRIPDLVTAGSPLVAVRVPDHALTGRLLAMLDFPLAAPSANPFGYISPTSARHVEDQLGDKIPYILNGGPCRVGVESTILEFRDGRPVVLRKGGVPIEAIESVIGLVEVRTHSTSNPNAPGMLQSHYAPRAPLVLDEDWDVILEEYANKRVGALVFHQKSPHIPEGWQVVLSEKGDLEEAAHRLFAAMRTLDAMNLDLILAEEVPEEGLGRAINDRLRRAAAI